MQAVLQQHRKRIGIVHTDADLLAKARGGASTWPLVDELKKLYEVVEVFPDSPITERYDVLLAVQPFHARQEADAALHPGGPAGQPTLIFEDPLPISRFAGRLTPPAWIGCRR